MAFKIPKLQYNNQSLTGTTTNTNATMTGVSNTDDLDAGMLLVGAGIPTGTTILSVGATSIVMSAPATASATISFDTHFEIEFDYPPIEKDGAQVEAVENISTSISGIRQVSINYLEEKRVMTLAFLTHAKYLLVDSFFRTYAMYGFSFRYFEDKTLTAYVEYELSDLKANPKKVAPKGADTYTWNYPLNMRRAL